MDLVIFEEFASGTAALDIRDQLQRVDLIKDEGYRRKFRKEMAQKYGVVAWNRDMYDTEIVGCPDESVVGKSFGQVADARGVQPVDAFLDLVSEYPGKVRWHTTIANDRTDVLNEAVKYRHFQLGNNDSGAHLRNMSFYNAGLRLLKRVKEAREAGTPFMSLEAAVHRLTGELGEWYGLDAGRLRIGDTADIAVIDPAGLDDSLDEYHEQYMEELGCPARCVATITRLRPRLSAVSRFTPTAPLSRVSAARSKQEDSWRRASRATPCSSRRSRPRETASPAHCCAARNPGWPS